MGKIKKIEYVYVLEYPIAGKSDRLAIRAKLQRKLPFLIQEGKGQKLIEDLLVLSIDEWNAHPRFSHFPLTPVSR